MGNNPVRIIDPLGDKWKDKDDERMAAQISGGLASQQRSLEKRERKLGARISKAEAKGKTEKAEGLRTTKADVTAQKNDVVAGQNELKALGEDQTTAYAFEVSDRANGYLSRGKDDEDGTINITINYLPGLPNQAHESKHAFQFSKRQVSLFAGTDAVRFTRALRPIDVEVQAYQRQYAVDPSSMPKSDGGTPTSMQGVNGSYVRGIYYYNNNNQKQTLYSSSEYKE